MIGVRFLYAVLLLVLLVAAGPRAVAQLPPEVERATPTERWVWEELRAGRPADIQQRCSGDPEARDGPYAQRREVCRTIRAPFLAWLLTQAESKPEMP